MVPGSMSRLYRLSAGLAVALSLASAARALGPVLLWSTDYNTTFGSYDAAQGAAIDSAGRTFVLGSTSGPWGLRAWDASGGLLWSKSLTTPGEYLEHPFDLALDAFGNIISAGWNGNGGCGCSQLWIIAYDSGGAPLWQTGGPTYTEAHGVAGDPFGNLLVAGGGDSFQWDMQKYNSGGGLVWDIPYPTPTEPSSAEKVASDSAGNAIFVGDIDTALSTEAWHVEKYSPGGVLLWATTFEATDGFVAAVNDVATDASDNIIVVGTETRFDIGQSDNWRIRKLSPAGALLWTTDFDDSSHLADTANSVAVASDGSILVAGSVQTTGEGEDWLVRSYSPAGNLEWSTVYNDPQNYDDNPEVVATGPEGSFVVAGTEYRTVGEQNWRVIRFGVPAALSSTLTVAPSGVCPGQSFDVSVSVTNTGGATLTGVTATVIVTSGGGRVNVVTGPVPPGPVSIGPGANQTFVWMFSGNTAGSVVFTSSVGGIDAGISGPVSTTASAGASVAATSALAAAAAAPVTVSVGQWFAVSMTVTNAGAVDVSGITATIFLGPGAPSAVWVGGPSPAGPLNLVGGSATTFVWTYSASGSGLVVFSATAAGLACGGPVLGAAIVSATVQTPAALAADLAVAPGTVCAGSPFLVELTVTNQGEAAANGLTIPGFLASGTGGGNPAAGPNPPMPASLPGGSSRTFTWTFTGSSVGTFSLSTTVLATDANSVLPVSTAPVVSGPEVVTATGALAATASPPVRVSIGQVFGVALTVTNTGGLGVTALAATLYAGTGGALVTLISAPAGTMSLAPAEATTYVWTFTAVSSGPVMFTMTALGSTLCQGLPVAVAVAGGTTAVVQTPAALQADVAAASTLVCVGQPIMVTLTVTNTGEADAASVGVPGTAFAIDGPGGMTSLAGPTPPLPVTLPGGASLTFSWTYAGTSPGAVTLTTTVAGMDANSGAALTSGPRPSPVVQVVPPGALAAAGLSAVQVFTGQWISVTLTVTNTGGAPVDGVTATVFVGPGGGLVSPVGGPVPPGPLTLTPLSATTFTWTYSASGAGTVTFTMTASGSACGGFTLSVAASATTLIQARAVLAASLSQNAIQVCAGQAYRVTLAVQNTGQASATGVTVSSPPFAQSGGGTATVTAGPTPPMPVTLAGGASLVFTWTLTGATAGGLLLTTTVSGSDTGAGGAVSTGPVSSNDLPVDPRLTVAVSHQPGTPGPGGPVTYTLLVTNTSRSTLSNLTIVDTLPSGITYASQSANVPGGFLSYNGATSGVLAWQGSFITMYPGQSATVTINGTVCGSGTISNTAWTASTGICSGLEAAAGEAFTLPATPPLSVVTTLTPGVPDPGGPMTYRIVVTNTGGATLSNLLIADTLPAGITFASQSANVPSGFLAYNGATSGVLAWQGSFITMYPGQSATVTVNGTVCGTGPISDTAWAASTIACGPVQAAGPPVAFTPAGPPALDVVVNHSPGLPDPGGPVTYQIVVTNATAATLSNLLVTDTLPAGVTFVSQSANVPSGFLSYNGATSGVLAWQGSFITMYPGQSATVMVNGILCGSGPISNTAWAATGIVCGTVQATSPTDAFPVAGPPSLQVGLSREPAVPQLGGPVSYRIVVSNASGATLSNLMITETLPPGITFAAQSASVPSGFLSYNGATSGVLAWQGSFITMYPGQSATVTIFGTVCGTGVASATGWAATSIVCGPVQAASPGDAFAVAPAPALTVVSTHTPATPTRSGPVSYQLLVTNVSGATLSSLLVTDTLPSGFSFSGQSSQLPNSGFASFNGATSGVLAWQGNFLTMYPGDSATVTINGSACGPGPTDNAAWAASGIVCGPVEAASPTDSFTPSALPLGISMNLVRTTPSPQPGQGVIYQLAVTNTGGATVSAMEITDTLPPELTIVGTAYDFTRLYENFLGPNGRWWHLTTFSYLYPGETLTTTIFATAACAAVPVSNTAWVTAGVGCVMAQAQSADAFALPPVGMLAGQGAGPSFVSIGQVLVVGLTVTNTGGSDVSAVTPSVVLGPGGGLVAGPTASPPGGGTLPPGAARTFEWTFTATGAGLVGFSLTVTGANCTGAPVLASAVISTTVQAAAALAAAATAYRPALCAGDSMLVTLTVTNTGQAAAAGVAPVGPFAVGGGGGVTRMAGPFPAGPVTLAGGAAVTFTWTYSGTTSGAVTLTNTATGTDANSGAGITGGATAGLLVQAAGALAGTAGGGGTVSAGQVFSVTLTVTNTGGADVTGITATAFVGPGGPLVQPVSGPAPAGPVTLVGGASQTFAWTYTAAGAGTASFTLSATGTSCAATAVLAAGAVVETIQSPATLAAAAAAVPASACVGQAFLVTLTVTNTGQAPAAGVAASVVTLAGTGAATAVGPTPAFPVTLAGGAAQTFTWTYTGSSAGTFDLSTTASGTDVNSGATVASGPAATAPVAVGAAGALTAAVSSAAQVSAGQWFSVALTVTNTGGLPVTGVTATLYAGPGGALATGGLGPVPAGPVSIVAGASQTFAWSFTAAGSGSVTFTMTAGGSTLCGGVPVAVAAAGTAATVVQAPAQLAVSVPWVGPAAACSGQPITVSLTVTNTGQADAQNVTGSPLLFVEGPGSVVAVSSPAVIPVLASGASADLVWAYTAGTAGALKFTATVTATDANGGWVVTSGPVSSGPASIGASGILSTTVVAPATTAVGRWFTVALTITNTGGADVTGITATSYAAGSAAVTLEAGPVPASLAMLTAGASQTFVFTYSASGIGTVTFTASAGGSSCSGALVTGAGTAGTAVLTPAVLVSSATTTAVPVSVGQWITASLTVTNTGQTAANAVTASASPAGSTAALTLTASATGPAILASGAAVTFFWTFSASGAGDLVFSFTATGADATTGNPVATSAVVPLPGAVLAPPVLTGGLAFPAPLLGWSMTVTLTVSNSGQVALTGIPAPLLGGSGAGILITSSPTGFPATLPPGGTLVLAWTVSVTTSGALSLSTTVSGVNAVSGAPASWLFAGGPPAPVGSPGLIVASIEALPTRVAVDRLFTVLMTVSNTGAFPVGAVQPSALTSFGTGQALLVTAPAGPAVLLNPGQSATFTWTYRSLRGGPVWFGGNAAGSGAPPAPAAASNRVVIDDGAGDLKNLLVYPTPFRSDRAVGGTLKFRMMPPRTEVRLYDSAGEKIREIKADGFGYAEWDGRNADGRPVAPGVYYYSAVSPAGEKKLGKIELARP